MLHIQHSLGKVPNELQLLRDLLERVALDDVADLILVEIAELDTALETDANFLHVVLEAAQGRKPAVVNRLATTLHARARSARNSAIGDEAACNDTARQLEDLLDLGVTDDGFAMLRIEHLRHRFFDLIDQLVNDRVKFNLHAFALRR